ncbi:MAG: acyl-CoA thioesterase [Treponema sp.]|jgi:acyl-CoA thioester hydrolase|nr:acyl-CoA thioesterase [Treponema sp.]
MYTITLSPRFGDADGLGHINNTVLAIWFELARNPVFRIFDPKFSLSYENWSLIMAHADYDFVGELFPQYDVEIRTFISRVGTKSFTVYHEAWQQGRLCVKGNAVIVHYDFKAKQSIPLPEDKRKLLQAHVRQET